MATRSRLGPAEWLFATTLAVVAVFVGAMLYVNHMTADIDRMATDIAGNADPSIRYLGTARTELRAIDTLLATSIRVGLQPAALRQRLEGRERRMQDALDAYAALPFFPTERERFDVANRDLRDVSRAADLIVAKLDAGDREGATTLLDGAFVATTEQADTTLDQLISFDADQGSRLGLEITRARDRASKAAYLLDGLVSRSRW